MRYSASTAVLIGILALCMTACGSSRTATSSKFQVSGFRSEVSSVRSQDSRDTVREQVVVAVHDTLREVTTITGSVRIGKGSMQITHRPFFALYFGEEKVCFGVYFGFWVIFWKEILNFCPVFRIKVISLQSLWCIN